MSDERELKLHCLQLANGKIDQAQKMFEWVLQTALNERIANFEEALQWCSGSADFNRGGQARLGWLKLCAPLLDPKRDDSEEIAELEAEIGAPAPSSPSVGEGATKAPNLRLVEADGYVAFGMGKTLDDNPWPIGTLDDRPHLRWDAGWNRAMLEAEAPPPASPTTEQDAGEAALPEIPPGFTRWEGGDGTGDDCPVGDAPVEYLTRDQRQHVRSKGSLLDWAHRPELSAGCADIIAYRILPPSGADSEPKDEGTFNAAQPPEGYTLIPAGGRCVCPHLPSQYPACTGEWTDGRGNYFCCPATLEAVQSNAPDILSQIGEPAPPTSTGTESEGAGEDKAAEQISDGLGQHTERPWSLYSAYRDGYEGRKHIAPHHPEYMRIWNDAARDAQLGKHIDYYVAVKGLPATPTPQSPTLEGGNAIYHEQCFRGGALMAMIPEAPERDLIDVSEGKA